MSVTYENTGAEPLQKLLVLCEDILAESNINRIKDEIARAVSLADHVEEPLKSVILDHMNRILDSRGIERAHYYIRSVIRDIDNSGSTSSLEFNINLWKAYDEIRTDSLWILGKRDREAGHSGWYWGNFVPQIPHQLMMRYTKISDWILDPFCGSGTTLIEAARLRRNSVGIEINPEVYSKAAEALRSLQQDTRTEIILGDSYRVDLKPVMERNGISSFDMVMLHPPYWDIIRFSENPADLSTSPDIDSFISGFKQIAKKSIEVLKNGGYLGLVIGDAYRDGEIVPLGFRCMDAVASLNMKIKGIIVKDIQNTRAKRSSENLWRYRALRSGFYIFKHEYVFVFQKL
ncbi:MAG: DNA methyltransferase [Thermoplasmataceae archaeon]